MKIQRKILNLFGFEKEMKKENLEVLKFIASFVERWQEELGKQEIPEPRKYLLSELILSFNKISSFVSKRK